MIDFCIQNVRRPNFGSPREWENDRILEKFFYQRNLQGLNYTKWECTSFFIFCPNQIDNPLYNYIGQARVDSSEKRARKMVPKYDW